MTDLDKLKKRLSLLGNGSDFELKGDKLWITAIDPSGLNMSAYGVECDVTNSKLQDIKEMASYSIENSQISGMLNKLMGTYVDNSEIYSEDTEWFRAMHIDNSKITLTKSKDKESTILLLRLVDSELTLKGFELSNFALDTLLKSKYEPLIYFHSSILKTDSLELYSKLVERFKGHRVSDRVAEMYDESRLEFIG